jgi:NADPH:quinone reductase-like Zn-dependent oxidoreductase
MGSIETNIPTKQIAITQIQKDPTAVPRTLPLAVNQAASVPKPPTKYHALVQVRAVALNPNDHKMVVHFNIPNGSSGCDLCGIIAVEPEDASVRAKFPLGTRVCGALFPYIPDDPGNGSFAQYCTVDSRLLVRVPDHWNDLQAASVGVAWSTISLALSDENSLALQGLPTKPKHEAGDVVLVYGGATASGTFAMQMLKL